MSRHTYKIHITDLEIKCSVGVLEQEKQQQQRVVVNLALTAQRPENPEEDNYENVVCYAGIISDIEKLLAEQHIDLLETMAQKVSQLCLNDDRISKARVHITKPDIIPNANVGVEFTARRPRPDSQNDD